MESKYWARLNLKQPNRRSLLAAGGTAALGVGAAAVVGCGVASTSAKANCRRTRPARRGRTLWTEEA